MKNKSLYILGTSFALTALMFILFAALIPCLYALIIPGILMAINLIASIVIIKKHKLNSAKKAIALLA